MELKRGRKGKKDGGKETFRDDDAYLYADKSGETELILLCVALMAICIVAFILTR